MKKRNLTLDEHLRIARSLHRIMPELNRNRDDCLAFMYDPSILSACRFRSDDRVDIKIDLENHTLTFLFGVDRPFGVRRAKGGQRYRTVISRKGINDLKQLLPKRDWPAELTVLEIKGGEVRCRMPGA